MAVVREMTGRRDSGLTSKCLERGGEKRLSLGGEEFFFLDSEFLWCHDLLFD